MNDESNPEILAIHISIQITAPYKFKYQRERWGGREILTYPGT